MVRIDIPLDLATAEGAGLELRGRAGSVAGGGGDLAALGAGGALPPGGSHPSGGGGRALEGAGVLPGGGEGGGAPLSGAGDQAGTGAGGGGAGLGTGAGLGAGAAASAGAGMERRLATQCRVPVPGIYFEFDSDVLNPASKPWIRSIAALLRRHPDWTITIEGHTDSVGVHRYNHDLSTRRAAALKRSLTSEHAIAAARLATSGFGLDRPLESNATPEGRARNRRVELVRPCDRPTR